MTETSGKYAGQECPACGSNLGDCSKISQFTLSECFTRGIRSCACMACGATWDEVIQVVGYEKLVRPSLRRRIEDHLKTTCLGTEACGLVSWILKQLPADEED